MSDASVDHATHIVYLGLGIVAVSLIPILRRRQNQGENDSNTKPPQETSAPRKVDATRPTHDESMKANIAAEPTSQKTPTGIVTKSGKAFALIACLLLAIFFFWHAIPGGKTRSASERTISPVLHQPEQTSATKSVTMNIEDVKIGSRVSGLNPDRDEVGELAPDPDPAASKLLSLVMEKEDASLLHIQLIRSDAWVYESGTVAGAEIFLDLPEMSAVGFAQVLAVEPCPPIECGIGNVVTGTFRHASASIIDLQIADVEPIGCTSGHLFWSADRREFIPAGHLQQGERVQLHNGETSHVVSLTPQLTPEPVYNIEVHNEHVYEITANGVLVHNSSAANLPSSFPQNGISMSTDSALDAAKEFLGPGYKSYPDGRFVSADGLRQVRMTDSDLLKANNHAGRPHMNFEIMVPDTKKLGRLVPGPNSHVFLPNEF